MAVRRILVTGSSGKLGSAIVQLFARRFELVQLDVREPADPDQRRIGDVIVGSVADRETVERAVEGVDAVIHCGAIPWNVAPFDELLRVNLIGTVNLLEAAGARASVERFIFVSTIRVHGVLEEVKPEFMPHFLPFDESHPCLTIEYYGGSKLHAEHWCRMYTKRFHKPVVAIRPSWICPLANEADLVASPPPEGPSLLQYVTTSDLVEGIRLALDCDPPDGFDAFLFHADDQRSSTPTMEYVERTFPNVPVDRRKLDQCDGFGALVDTTHAKQALSWRPRVRLGH